MNKGRLGDHCEVFAGYAFKSSNFTDDSTQIPLVKGENVGQGIIHWQISKYWPIEKSDGLERYRLLPGDVILAMDRPWIPAGLKYAWIKEHDPESLLVQRVARLRATDGLDQTFLRYVVGASRFSAYIEASTRGVSVPHISGRQIEDYRFELPALRQQQRIASILSSYDDLIENNRRRMALLEESARLLYQEWFVRLRFPGHEHVKVVDGVPEGWGRKRLNEITSFLKRGITPRYDEDADGLVINQKCIRGGWLNMELARRQSKEVPQERQVQVGDVLVNSTGEGTLGRVAQVKSPIERCTVDTHVTIVRPHSAIAGHYFGIAVMAWEPRFSTMGRGATNQTELSPSAIGEAEIILPSRLLLAEFELIVDPIYQQITRLAAQNEKLRTARDLLLPRLMSGELIIA